MPSGVHTDIDTDTPRKWKAVREETAEVASAITTHLEILFVQKLTVLTLDPAEAGRGCLISGHEGNLQLGLEQERCQ